MARSKKVIRITRSAHAARNAELATLAQRGKLTASAVVNYARNPETALHRAFTWDDSKAAELYRLDEARHIIRAYVIVVQSVHGPRNVRALWSLPSDRAIGAGYTRTQDILSNQNLLDELVESALKEVASVQERYESVKVLSPIWEAAAQVRASRRRKVAA